MATAYILSFHAPIESPKSRNIKIRYTYKKEKRGDSVLAHPTCPGLRIALFAEKDNAESPRMDILFPYATNCIHTILVYIQQITIGYNTPTVNIYHCLILLRISLKLRS